jgi:hypothetical protein
MLRHHCEGLIIRANLEICFLKIDVAAKAYYQECIINNIMWLEYMIYYRKSNQACSESAGIHENGKMQQLR